jgi:uncharacterized protein YbcI
MLLSGFLFGYTLGRQGAILMQMGEFKQEIMKVNNRVNMEVFNQGLKAQKVEVFQDKILIVANNNRVKALAVVDGRDRLATKMMDIALLMEFKDRFAAALEDHLGIKALSHLKDYDPKLELSISITILEKPVEELLPLISKKQNL